MLPVHITNSISEVGDLFNFDGINFHRLAVGIGVGVWIWAVGKPVNLALAGLATGPTGAGIITPFSSKLVIPLVPAIGIMRGAFLAVGINGVLANPLAAIVATGICQSFNKHMSYTAPVTLGAGVDVSKVVVANPLTLAAILTGTLVGTFTGAGPSLPMLVSGLSAGICGALLLGTGSGRVVGVPSVPAVPVTVPTFSTVV